MAIAERERTSAEIGMYALNLYFLGLSFRNHLQKEVIWQYGNGYRGFVLSSLGT
jgi:hypothetical protein